MKGTEKERKYFRKNKFFALCLLIATLFMGVGYAAYSSVTLGIGGKVSAIYEEKIYILENNVTASLKSNNSLVILIPSFVCVILAYIYKY